MKILTFQGYSDDTFACEGPGIDVDKDTCASGEPVTMCVSSVEGAMLVIGQYAAGHSGGWQIAVAPFDPRSADDATVNIPDWPISIVRSARHYSPMLVVTAPDDVAVAILA
jgi:hypothetical protein